MKYSAILFDFDGTLLESGPCIIHTLRRTLRELGFDQLAAWSDGQLRPMVGPPLREGFSAYMGLPEEYVDRAIQVYRSHADDPAVLSLLRPYPGIPDMLRTLREKGCKLAIATAKHNSVSTLHLKQAGLDQLVDYLSATKTDQGCDKAQLIREALAPWERARQRR